MLTEEEIRERLYALPDIIKDHLFDENIADINNKLIASNSVESSKKRALFRLINELVLKAVPLERLISEIEARFGYDAKKAKAFAIDIAGYRLLPFDVYLGDVTGYITSLGGDPERYPKTRVKVEERTTDAAIGDVEHTVAIGQLPHRLKSRFEDAVRSYFKGVRTDSQLIDILTRPEKIGGVNLSKDVAREVVRRAQEERKSVVIEDKSEQDHFVKSSVTPADSIHGKTPSSAHSPKPASKFATILPEDEDEIEAIRKNASEGEIEKSADTDEKIKASVEEIYKVAGVGLGSSEALIARFKKIIENRLRDVRDGLETLEILVQPKELGGLSLSEDDARRILALIEGKLRTVHEEHQKEVGEKKAEWVAKKTRDAIERSRAEKVAEAEARDEAFRMAIARSKKIGSKIPPAPPANLPVPSGNASAPVPPSLPIPVPAPRAMLRPSQGGKSASAPSRVASFAGSETKGGERVPEPMKQPPPTPLRPESSMKSSTTIKPIMEDVKSFVPKATGPVEALRTTSLQDFRRLSKDPKEAILKIKDKIDLLGEDSFSKRSEGIVAWRESGVFMLYLEMMREALEGKSMEEVITERKETKKPYLSKEEMDAIVSLGVALRP